MSSILKALKKLEQESDENTGVPLSAGSAGRTKRRPGSFVVPGLIIFTLCLFSGVGILIYTQHTSDPESFSVDIVDIIDEKPLQGVKIPAEKSLSPKKTAAVDIIAQHKTAALPGFEFSTAGPSGVDKQQQHAKKSGQKLPDVQPPKMPPANPPKHPIALADSAPVSASIKPGVQVPPITPVPDAQPGAADEIRPHASEKAESTVSLQPEISVRKPAVSISPILLEKTPAPKPVEEKTEPPAAVIEDPAVELQAISWSADPDKRMAIINGKICREKDRVAGYVIQSINSGDVVVVRGSETGKLVFKIR